MKRVKPTPRLSRAKFTNANSAESNRVFLFENHTTSPFIRPVKGWNIVGYGAAPWPGSSNGFAVMLEKNEPAQEKGNIFAPEHIRFDEGTRIWQHLSESHFWELDSVKIPLAKP